MKYDRITIEEDDGIYSVTGYIEEREERTKTQGTDIVEVSSTELYADFNSMEEVLYFIKNLLEEK